MANLCELRNEKDLVETIRKFVCLHSFPIAIRIVEINVSNK